MVGLFLCIILAVSIFHDEIVFPYEDFTGLILLKIANPEE